MKAFEQDGVWLKVCCRCDGTKTIDQYHRCKKAVDGLQERCRECHKKAMWKEPKPRRKSYQAYAHEGRMVKECTKCHGIKDTSEFHSHRKKDRPKQDGLSSLCKICQLERSTAYIATPKGQENTRKTRKRHYARHADKCKELSRRYQANPENRKKINARRKMKMEEDPEHRQKVVDRQRVYRADPDNRARRNADEKARRESDPAYKLLTYARNFIRQAILDNLKSAHTEEMLGCTVDQFKSHIESQFVDGMSWDNWGNEEEEWSIDHILPCELFDFSLPSHQMTCFRRENVRPIWHKENISKQDKLDDGRRARDLTPEEKMDYLLSKGYAHLFEPSQSSTPNTDQGPRDPSSPGPADQLGA